MKAWLCTLWDIPGIVRAPTRAAARYAMICAARDAGYNAQFTERVSVKRAPEFDAFEALKPGCSFAPEYAAQYAKAEAAVRDSGGGS